MSDQDEPDIIEHLNLGRGLRLIKTPEPKRKPYEPDPEITAMFDDIRRQQAEREERDPVGKDAA